MMGVGPMAGVGVGFGWLGMLLGALVWVGLLVVVVWGLTRLFAAQRPTQKSTQSGSAAPSALDILKQRFARGEITEAEYQQARKALA